MHLSIESRIFLLLLVAMIGTADVFAAEKQVTSSRFNPAISLILNGSYSQFDNDPELYRLPGFALAEETGPGEEGFSLAESELTLSGNIDDRFYGSLTAAITPNNELELEEAYFDAAGLAPGFSIRAGRFYSSIGYLNNKHSHRWDFVDQPLVYRAMLGNQYSDDGIQLRWLAPTILFAEFGAEYFRGDRFPAGGAANDGKGTYTMYLHVGGDVGVSHSWRSGLSFLNADSDNRETGEPADIFTGTSRLAIIDFIWKWAPNGNPRQRNLKLQAEYFFRNEDGNFNSSVYKADQQGWYLQGVYQFIPRWRVGLRLDALMADDPGSDFTGTVLDTENHDPRRISTMVDFSYSGFSRFRLQYNRDESSSDVDNQVYLQYTMSLGAHGAHKF